MIDGFVGTSICLQRIDYNNDIRVIIITLRLIEPIQVHQLTTNEYYDIVLMDNLLHNVMGV